MTRIARCLLALAFGACAGASSELRHALARGDFAGALASYEHASSPEALVSIAEAFLEREARGEEAARRDAAFGALTASGTHGETVLARLTTDERPSVRARALASLARLGDAAARRALGDYVESQDGEARAAAVEALDAEHDATRLLRLARDAMGGVRLAAVRALGDARPSDALRLLLAEVARQDPRADVRAAALGALVGHGSAASDAIDARLDDQEHAVRAAAVAALLAVDPERARLRLDRWLASDPSRDGIEAARLVIAKLGSGAPPAARTQLARALAAADAGLRAQAAVALGTLAEHELAAEWLAVEPTRHVRLSLALALGTEDERARPALLALAAGTDVAAAQAAAELARRGDDSAREKLITLRASESVAIRRTVVRALGRDLGRAHDVRAALLDADASVRVAAAAAILVGAA